MFGVCLAISIFTQFSPQQLWMLSSPGPSAVAVEFEKLNGIRVGAPVLVEGQLIGSVTAIHELNPAEAKTGLKELADSAGAYQVNLKVAPHHRTLLRRGTIALIKSPLSAGHVQPQAVVELLLPDERNAPVLHEGEHIVGYSSFQEFWSADLTRRGLAADAFQLS